MPVIMNNYIYQQFAGNVELMPIRSVFFQQYDPDGKEQSIYNVNLFIANIEAESNYKFTPITKNTFFGQTKRFGYKFEATIYIPYNKYQNNNLRTLFENILIYNYSFHLSLGTEKPHLVGGYDPPDSINSTAGMTIYINFYQPSHTIEIESVEYRPRMILRLFQIVPHLSYTTFVNSNFLQS